MTVYDFVELLTDDGFELSVYDLNTEKVVFKGPAREALWDDVANYEIWSIDVPEHAWKMTVNIDTAEG